MGRRKIPRHDDGTPLEPDRAAMRRLLAEVGERLVEHLATIGEQPTSQVAGGRKLAHALREPMPERGAPLERVLRLLFGRVVPASLNTASPGYMAYIPGGGLYTAALADLVALGTNRYATLWQAGPGLAQIEKNVLDWIAASLGMPEATSGIFTSGGSLANLTAIVTARHDRLPPDFLRGTLYCSDQIHHSVTKAARIAGFPSERVRVLPSDAELRLDPNRLEAAIAADRALGLSPFSVVASAGTTNTGAIDPLDAIAKICARERLWLHVDAAYGGFFAWTERGRARLGGIELADSVTLDPHKSLFLPYGTGCLLVRDREALRRAHAERGAYLPAQGPDPDWVDACDLSPELSREARGLRVWLPLKLHGARAFREALDEKIDLARHAADAIAKMSGMRLVTQPELSLFAFRYEGDGQCSEAELEAVNRKLLAAINARQRAFLTGTTLPPAPGSGDARFVLRLCVLSVRTHREHVDRALEDLEAALGEVLA